MIYSCTRVIPVWLPISIFIMNSEFAGGELILIDLTCDHDSDCFSIEMRIHSSLNHCMSHEIMRIDSCCAAAARPPRDDVAAGGCHVAPRHLARRYAARAFGGRWGRTRHAGGPARAKEQACPGFGRQVTRERCARRARKEASNVMWHMTHPQSRKTTFRNGSSKPL